MDRYIEAEKRLAELLGHKAVYLGTNYYGAPALYSEQPDSFREILPRWCRDNAAAFALMVEHECWPDGAPRRSAAGIGVAEHEPHGTFEFWDDHPDRDTAVRYCVVMAVIAKLSTQQEPNNV